jgi:hypothetical protein
MRDEAFRQAGGRARELLPGAAFTGSQALFQGQYGEPLFVFKFLALVVDI